MFECSDTIAPYLAQSKAVSSQNIEPPSMRHVVNIAPGHGYCSSLVSCTEQLSVLVFILWDISLSFETRDGHVLQHGVMCKPCCSQVTQEMPTQQLNFRL